MPGPNRVPRPEWSPLPHEGTAGVEGKLLLRSPNLVIAMLRLSERATIAEHEAPMEFDVVCLDGEGSVSVRDETFVFGAGDAIRWPAHTMHRLWTDASEMTTLMVEHHD